MNLFLQQVIDGISSGAIYASLALALVFSYRSSGIINFAQGEMAMLSTYFAWQLMDWGVPIIVALLLTLLVSFAVGAAVYAIVIRPIADAHHLTLVVITVGMFVVFNAIAGLVWGFLSKSVPSPASSSAVFEIATVHVSVQVIVIVGVVLLAVGLLYLLLAHTKVGLAMRAAAAHREGSRLVGIRVLSMLVLGWGIAGALGGLSGVLVAPQLILTPTMMQAVLIYAFAAAALGGFDSVLGAVVGGFVVGIAENLVGAYVSWLGADLKVLVPFAIIFIVLIVRPEGLFGHKQAARV